LPDGEQVSFSGRRDTEPSHYVVPALAAS
jgi:hypothetical protein